MYHKNADLDWYSVCGHVHDSRTSGSPVWSQHNNELDSMIDTTGINVFICYCKTRFDNLMIEIHTRNFDLHITVPSPNLAFLCRNLDYKPYSINQSIGMIAI